MANKTILRWAKRLTRAQFEQRLGGEWQREDGTRTNGDVVTFKDWSKEVQERIDCFAKYANGTVVGAASWDKLAQKMGV